MIALETSLLISLIASNIGKMVQSAHMYDSALQNSYTQCMFPRAAPHIWINTVFFGLP